MRFSLSSIIFNHYVKKRVQNDTKYRSPSFQVVITKCQKFQKINDLSKSQKSFSTTWRSNRDFDCQNFCERFYQPLVQIEILDINHMLHPQQAPVLNFFSNEPKYSSLIEENRSQDMTSPKSQFYHKWKYPLFKSAHINCFIFIHQPFIVITEFLQYLLVFKDILWREQFTL